jgi:hypothetical protein
MFEIGIDGIAPPSAEVTNPVWDYCVSTGCIRDDFINACTNM